MSTCNANKTNRNNGLITKIWGGPSWIFNHSVTFGYPLEPTDEQKNDYKNYFILLGKVLPCRYCRESYDTIINTGETALTDEVLINRDSLTKWFYLVHEAVNQKLGINYGITYNDVIDRYESFRAKCGQTGSHANGCVVPLNYKAFSYRKVSQIDCPVISLEVARPFIVLAKIRKLDPEYFIFLELVYTIGADFNKLKQQPAWIERNRYCHKQIVHMREHGIPSIETDGIWRGTPTIDELKLLVFLSSNLGKLEIQDCIKILHKNETYLSNAHDKKN